MLYENIKLALASMWQNKMRTLLSLLGIVIGVAAVVAILTLGDSAKRSITDSIASGGLNLISIYPNRQDKAATEFTEDFGITLMRNIDGIDSVMGISSGSALIRHGQQSKQAAVSGVPSTYAQVNNYEAEEGEFFSMMDNINRRQVIVLGADIAEDLFPAGDAIGQYVSLFRRQAKSYLVVGVMKEKDAGFAGAYNTNVYIPYNTFQQRFQATNNVGSYLVDVSENADTSLVTKDITSYLDNLVGNDAYTIFSPSSLADIANEITGTFTTFLAAVAAISLLVGGIGIMNIMLVSVAERTREIGVRKALGASPRVIRGQFLWESITLTVVGGLLGSILATVLSYVITTALQWKFAVSPMAYLMAVGFSMVIGIFFGWYPAMKAARLDPIESLNYE
ncbi:ABC transporter permease [Parasphaerochaeta coccoides]|uniref:Uncharacterized protein n=1 Tax=Parasphaerochaeta coccoides (strain ATCC BAA-1237 / DSM 17374 / SPN1) TaxID=760011 RepID=F4GHH1_PARC1|nr:ABC transporter permease [Parasphaerochaeta coccoides]AEC02560.1 protein of unknown function DUF214 [Parasphaerochaeta coccoides DSM 17374]